MLVVEDEPKIRELLRAYLERAGLSVLTTGSGAEAITLSSSTHVDAIVLDLRLPDVPGEEVAREVRRQAATPILMLTAKAGEDDRIAGLELGADDYVTKPFSPREVVLRVQAILRRAVPGGSDEAPESFGGGRLLIDDSRRSASVDGASLDLTPTEWGLLTALASTPGRVFSREELLNRVRGYEFASPRAVDSHIKNLRRKLQTDPDGEPMIETVLGAGYRLGLARDR